MKSRLSLMVVFAAFASTTVLGQIAVQMREQTGANGSITGDFTVQPPPILPAAITGAPYSADQVSEHTQTLADGTHITQSQRVEHLYRDSAGRTRTERPIFGGPNAPEDLPLMIEILDPVARLEYILDTEKHIAHRYTVQPQTPSRALPASAPSGVIGAARNRTAVSTGAAVVGGLGAATTTVGAVPLMHLQNTSESLGTQVIEGVLTEGTRRTITYAAGSVGNDRPFSSTQEIWTSPELKIMVLSKNDDPRSGESITRLINLSRSEPDAALFQPPPDYKVVDDTGPVTIKFTRP